MYTMCVCVNVWGGGALEEEGEIWLGGGGYGGDLDSEVAHIVYPRKEKFNGGV